MVAGIVSSRRGRGAQCTLLRRSRLARAELFRRDPLASAVADKPRAFAFSSATYSAHFFRHTQRVFAYVWTA